MQAITISNQAEAGFSSFQCLRWERVREPQDRDRSDREGDLTMSVGCQPQTPSKSSVPFCAMTTMKTYWYETADPGKGKP